MVRIQHRVYENCDEATKISESSARFGMALSLFCVTSTIGVLLSYPACIINLCLTGAFTLDPMISLLVLAVLGSITSVYVSNTNIRIEIALVSNNKSISDEKRNYEIMRLKSAKHIKTKHSILLFFIYYVSSLTILTSGTLVYAFCILSTPSSLSITTSILIILVTIIILFLARYAYNILKIERAAETQIRIAKIRNSTIPSSNKNGETLFCHQCGKKQIAGSQFCPYCGTKLL